MNSFFQPDEFEIKIMQERVRQEEKWGEQDHNPSMWLTIIMEEIGELAQASLLGMTSDKKHPNKDMEKELIQSAAVLRAMWECGKRNNWLGG